MVSYSIKKYGGYGFKIRNGVRIYSVPGSDQAVSLSYRVDSGATRHVVVTAEDPVALAADIQRARELRIATPGARIATEPSLDAEALGEELQAAEEDEADEKVL